jgi:hypothetical protein
MVQETTMFFHKHSFIQVSMMDEFFLNTLLVDIISNLTLSGEVMEWQLPTYVEVSFQKYGIGTNFIH